MGAKDLILDPHVFTVSSIHWAIYLALCRDLNSYIWLHKENKNKVKNIKTRVKKLIIQKTYFV